MQAISQSTISIESYLDVVRAELLPQAVGLVQRQQVHSASHCLQDTTHATIAVFSASDWFRRPLWDDKTATFDCQKQELADGMQQLQPLQ